MDRAPLPIDAVLSRLVEALRGNNSAVLRAPTGAGKTTRVPPALLDAGLAGEGSVLMLEPRRLAARAAARRMAAERGGEAGGGPAGEIAGEIGGEIGYHVRFDRQASSRTRILVVTEGLLVRMLQDDPFLERFGAVILDEFHERNLDTDLALALVRKVQLEARQDLRLVVMSATIETGKLAHFLGDCPAIESEGRLHPVEVAYLGSGDRRPLEASIAAGVARAIEATSGDVLAFLPGVGEIRRAREALEPLARQRDLALMDLYGDLPAEQQDAVLRRAERRKIVLATNVAETSVTIEGVSAVVDSGLARILRFDPSVGIDRLELSRISRVSADQRAGRAGRTGPGICLRLWSEREHRSMNEREEPEIRRVDLAGPALQLRCFGEGDLSAFPWFEPPAEAALRRAVDLLERLGAFAAHGVTEIGRAMGRIPAHPRIARLLLEGTRLQCVRDAALAGAMLAERNPFLRGPARRSSRRTSDSDVLDRVCALEDFERSGRASSEVGELNPGAARFALRVRDDLLRHAGHSKENGAPENERAFLRALLAAYPDRVARRRAEGGRRGVMVGGRGVRLADESAVGDAELFLCIDIDAGRRGKRAEAIVRQSSAVEREWLPEERVRTEIAVAFDEQREAVTAVKRTLYEDLVLEEAQIGLPESEAVAPALAGRASVARALIGAARIDLGRALPLKDEEVSTFLCRLRCLREWMPELGLPSFDVGEMEALLPELCQGARSFEDLRKLPLVDILKSKLSPAQLRALEREAPERIRVPSGSWIALTYERDRPPVLAVRIQEVFGLADTPRIAGGRVKVLMHLLAPNHRPQQVTEDLRSFWNGAYAEVRKDLRRRYPRHAWPEDPWNASPERRPRRR